MEHARTAVRQALRALGLRSASATPWDFFTKRCSLSPPAAGERNGYIEMNVLAIRRSWAWVVVVLLTGVLLGCSSSDKTSGPGGSGGDLVTGGSAGAPTDG